VSSGSRRAAALSPEERRTALIQATLPLVLAYGTDVSTRRIAEAAGVAEGTIFRAFPTKNDLLDAVVAHAFDSTELREGLLRIDLSAPLEERLVAVVELLQQRTHRVWHLLHVLGATPGAERPARPDADERWAAGEALITDAVAALLEPDQDRLRCHPLEAARRLRQVTLATSHPRLTGGDHLSAADTVSLLLDGIRMRSEPSSPNPAPDRADISAVASPIGTPSC
jgi:AcrR family transcriptional regulator